MTKTEDIMMRQNFPWLALVLVLGLVLAASPAGAQSAAKPALENDYVRVSQDSAPCASAAAGRCEDRVILAMGDLTLKSGAAARSMTYGQIAVFRAGKSYEPPAGGAYFEVAVKPGHPPVKSPPELIPPPKNLIVYEAPTFFIYEEKLAVGDTRPRHSHSQRVEIRLNNGPRLHQWVEQGGKVSESEPSIVNWREPIIHTVKNIGDMPLRNFILEFLPDKT
jgi:hypothetical protein